MHISARATSENRVVPYSSARRDEYIEWYWSYIETLAPVYYTISKENVG